MFKNVQKRPILLRLEQNGYLTNNQRPKKHYNSHLMESKNFDLALILLKKLDFTAISAKNV